MTNAEKVRRAHALWMAGDVRAAFDMAHPDIEWAEPPENIDSKTDYGPEWAAMSLTGWSEQFAELRAEIVELKEHDDKVLAIYRQAARPHGGTVEIEQDFFMVWTFREGLAVRMQMFNKREDAVAAFDG